ncbi:MAG TPA: glycosyltransferase family 4 protein [Caulobacteraceae bacterium]
MIVAELVSARVLNGAARHSIALSQALAERGHEVLLLHRPELDLPALPAGVTPLATGFRRSPGTMTDLARRLKAAGTEVIHTHMSSAHFHGALLRTFWGVPTVAAAHARHFQPHWLFNDRVIAPSRSTAAYHLRVNRISPARLRVIPNFIDPDAYPQITPERRAAARARLGLDPDALVIGSVADITPGKRPSDLIAAARPLLQAGARLVIAGAELDAGEATRVRAAAAAGLGVELLGRRTDVAEILPAFDVFALASEREEMPMAVLEAMAAGLPVVAVDTGGLPEMVAEGETGFLVGARDTTAMGERLQRLADDPALRARMGAAGRARAFADFGRGPIVERIEAVLAEAAALRPGWRG